MRRSKRTYSSVDPFKPSIALSAKRLHSTNQKEVKDRTLPDVDEDDDLTCAPKILTEGRTVAWSELNPNVPREPVAFAQPQSKDLDLKSYLYAFTVDTLPRQIYLLFLLRIPSLYFSRVSRIFEEAELSIKDIKQGLLEHARRQAEPWLFAGTQEVTSEPYENLQKSWGAFIDSLIQEWNTLNLVSVLLLGALLTALQLDGASTDPITRFSALIAMICALMSLMYGCMYIIRFGTMRKTYKAAEWANEAKNKNTGVWWNVWVMLSLPVVWLAWSIILYIVCIMSYVWRTGTDIDSTREPFTVRQARAPRIIITVVLGLGVLYFIKVGLTLRSYGDVMDRAWQDRLQSWLSELYSQPGMMDPGKLQAAPSAVWDGNRYPYHSGTAVGGALAKHNQGGGHGVKEEKAALRPLEVTKLMALTDYGGEPIFDIVPVPSVDVLKGIMTIEDWEKLRDDIRNAWPKDAQRFPEALQVLENPVELWNNSDFRRRGGVLELCEERKEDPEGYGMTSFGLYHFQMEHIDEHNYKNEGGIEDTSTTDVNLEPGMFKGIPEGLERVDVLKFSFIDDPGWKPLPGGSLYGVGRYGLWPQRYSRGEYL